MATAVLATSSGSHQVARRGKLSVSSGPKSSGNDDGITFERFYDEYCTKLKLEDEKREAYKANHPEWKSVEDDEFGAAQKGLLIMDDSDKNVFVRCRRLRLFAEWAMKKVEDPEEKAYISNGIVTINGIQTSS
jgi:hypothetical protein